MIIDPYDPAATAETFDTAGWIASQDWRLLRAKSGAGRRLLTRLDPMLFMWIYLRHHLSSEDTGGEVTFADAHFEWYRLMRQWVKQYREPREWRHAIAAPRSCAKSTIWFLGAPLWAGVHGHAKFVAAFADSGTQAEMHLQSFRSELAGNTLLRHDWPEFCRARRKPTGRTVADNEGMFQCQSGFVFAARGADTATLGMKVGNQRPDVLILDDIEKHEAKYSLNMVGSRRSTIINAIFPLNERARVVIVGTTTRAGSIVHQLVQVADGEADQNDDEHRWIGEEKITPHHHLPIVQSEDGERSIWPAKWSLDYLKSIAGTRSYDLNMLCNPRAADGVYWSGSDFIHGVPGPVARVYCWVDPPVTSRAPGSKTRGSDPAGIAIVGYLPEGAPGLEALLDDRRPEEVEQLLSRRKAMRRLSGLAEDREAPAVVVFHAEEQRLTGRPLMRYVAALLTRFSAQTGKAVRGVFIEVNQGGDLWREPAEDLGVPFQTYTASDPKADRFMKTLDLYQAVRVFHATELPAVERQMVAYPAVEHDDVMDAVSAGVLAFLAPRKTHRSETINL